VGVVAVIQARMGGTRLPGKVLADLGGAPALARVVIPSRGATSVQEVEVASSIEPELIDKTVNAFLDHQSDYATNSLIVTYPRGLDVEVFTWAALVRAWHEAKEFYQRVHVTPYIYQNPQLFRLFSLTSESDDSQYRWTLDTAEDLEIIRAIYVHFGNRVDFHWRDVTALMDREPDLAELNAHIRQKTLHEG